MEPRIAKLEAHVEHILAAITELKDSGKAIQSNVAQLHTNVGVLTERVDHLPSKGFIVSAVLVALAVVTALLVFQGQIQTLVGTAPAP